MAESPFPPIPDAPLREGSRWRHHKPSSDEVAAWFATQPLDEDMAHDHYVSGIVLIPQREKVTYTFDDGTRDRYEMTYTPYMQIGTRIAYFRRLAEQRELIPRIEPVPVPRSNNPSSPYFNAHMEEGLWWHVVQGDSGPLRYLCATWRVALYEPTEYLAKLRREYDSLPRLEGRGTKQVGGGPDMNAIAKAQTGAAGRALGVAGILVVGTGIATAEDMEQYAGAAGSAAELATLPPTEVPAGQQPPPVDAAEQADALRARAMELATRMQEDAPEVWRTFSAWYAERSKEEGWSKLDDVPPELLKSVVVRMEQLYYAPTGVEAK